MKVAKKAVDCSNVLLLKEELRRRAVAGERDDFDLLDKVYLYIVEKTFRRIHWY